MKITICDREIDYQIVDDVYLFDVRELIKLNWKSDLYYYKKWLKTNPPASWQINDVWYCEYNQFIDFFHDNPPTEKGKADTIIEFVLEENAITDLINTHEPEPEPELIEKSQYDQMISAFTQNLQVIESTLKDKEESYEKLKNKYDKLLEKSKKKSTLKDLLSHPELPLYAQLTTTIVLTFFTWTVFAHYFDFGSFSEYSLFHGLLTLFAAVAFEFGLLIFTVRKNTMWLNVSLVFQFIILGIHSGLLEFNYTSVEDFMIKFVLTSLLPITNKAFASTIFK